MNDDKRDQTLRELADLLQQRQLAGPARLFLDVIEPVAFLASQFALFTRPLTPHGRWHDYVDALTDETSWHELQRFVKR